MKKLFIIIGILLSQAISKAQTYYPFATDSAFWSVDFMTMGLSWSTVHAPRLYYLDGDTTIGTTQYSKMCLGWDSIPNPLYPCNSPVALLRDSNKTIYCRYRDNPNGTGLNTEFVLYNFNLNAGDTFTVYVANDSDMFVVNTIDSELTSSGYHKAWNLQKVSGWSTSLYNPRWVEGIGDIQNGVLYVEVPWVDWWCQGWCYKEWQTLVWSWTNGPCFNTSVVEHDPENEFSMVNDLIHQTIDMQFQISALRKIELMDLTGKVLLSETTLRPDFKIHTNNFVNGIYFVKVTGQGISATRKVILF